MTSTCHWAAPGVRCVCIDADWPEVGRHLPFRMPMLGEVLTVRSVETGQPVEIGCTFFGDSDEVYLTFWEIPTEQGTDTDTLIGLGWITKAFRPLVEQETDISVFTEILDTAPVRETVEVGDER